MNLVFVRLFVACFFSLMMGNGFTQYLLSGYITDEKQVAIPFVTLFVKNNPELRTSSDEKGYYEMSLQPGEYFLIFNSLGYNEREAYITITDRPIQRDIQLFPSKMKELQDVSIHVKKSNPGREIMLNVVAKRDRISLWNYPHTVDVYTRATERIEYKEKKQKIKRESTSKTDITSEPFDDEKSTINKDETNKINLVEVQLTRHFAPPNKEKEYRNGYQKYGNEQRLYYTTTVKSNFNFFQNLLHLDDLHQSPVSSPISVPGILSYKYRLEAQHEEKGRKIHKIRIIPRNTATSTLEGFVWVIDSLWLIQKLELTLNKGNLLLYDCFTIRQTFEHPGDSMCVLTHQELEYGINYKNEKSSCITVTEFEHYAFTPAFDKKFFRDLQSETTEEAYQRDSSFWKSQRKFALSPEEQSFILSSDSLRDVHSRKNYLDSIDSIFNKITFSKVLLFGIDHRNRAKKTQWTISSLSGLLRPIYIAGPRFAPSFYYFKKWKNERSVDSYTETSVGVQNLDLKGRTWWRYNYAPFHFGALSFSFSHDFDAIRSYDAITQIYKRENFIQTTTAELGNNYELFNGCYLNTSLEFSERSSLRDYKFITSFDNVLPNNSPMDFKTYQALIANTTLTYTPKQAYMKEAKKKVLLGSRFPTLYLTYERGVPRLFGSDIDHEYGRIGLMQTFKISTLGTSSYHLLSGKFLSSKKLMLADFKFQRRSDPIWFSNPLYSFQGLDSSLPSKDYFLEGHFVHHDNGAIINKLPFMKKLNLGIVMGVGALYVKEFNWQYYELFTGIERNFKFSRRRLRIGFYTVASDGNKMKPRLNYKISFAFLDDRTMKWNF
jgi:hypothetical protein